MRPPLSRRSRAMILNVHNRPESMAGCANCCKMCCGYTTPAIILLLSVGLGGASEAYYIYLVVQDPQSGWRVFLCVLFALLCPVITGAILWAFHRVTFTSPGYVPSYPWRYVPQVSGECLQRMARNPQALALYTQQQQQLRQFQQQLYNNNNTNNTNINNSLGNTNTTTVMVATSALDPDAHTNTNSASPHVLLPRPSHTSHVHTECAMNNEQTVHARHPGSHSPLSAREEDYVGQQGHDLHKTHASLTTTTTTAPHTGSSSSSSSNSSTSTTTSSTSLTEGNNNNNNNAVIAPLDHTSLSRRCVERNGELVYLHNSPTAPSQHTPSSSSAKPSPSFSLNNNNTNNNNITSVSAGGMSSEQPGNAAPGLPFNHYVVTQLDRYSQLRFCRTCNQYKPDDAHHCSICQRCVYNFDHHCPFINNCVGRNNYLLFVVFLFYSSVGCVLIMAMDFVALFAVDEHEVFDKMGWMAMPIILAALGLGLGLFYMQHRMLIAEGKSTLDTMSPPEHRTMKEECSACLSKARSTQAHLSEEQKLLKRQAKAERVAAHRRAVLGVGGPWWRMYVPIPVRTDTLADEVIV